MQAPFPFESSMAPYVPGEIFNLKNRDLKQCCSVFVSDLAGIGNPVIRFIERVRRTTQPLGFFSTNTFDIVVT